MTSRRILLVVSSMDAGGVETYIVNVLTALDREGFDVTIACTRGLSEWYQPELDALGVDVVDCPNPYSQLGYMNRVGSLITERKIDAVCDFRSALAGSTLLAARRAGVRSRVACCRSTGEGYRRSLLRDGYMSAMKRLTRRTATRILGNSEPVLDAFDPSWRDRPELYGIVRNGVDTAKFRAQPGGEARARLGIPADALVVGHVGRFHEAKNHKGIVAAFAKLKQSVPGARLLLVGDGALRASIETQVQASGLTPDVTWAGASKDVPELLAAADIFFFPSRYEGMPNALLEAMACELPVVASDIPEIRSVVPEAFGSTLHELDDIDGFARSLAELSADRDERHRLGRMGRARVIERFSIQTSADQLSNEWVAALAE